MSHDLPVAFFPCWEELPKLDRVVHTRTANVQTGFCSKKCFLKDSNPLVHDSPRSTPRRFEFSMHIPTLFSRLPNLAINPVQTDRTCRYVHGSPSAYGW